MMSKIADIKEVDSMISFLKEKGGNHEYYYHYTTWDSLSKILRNKTFLLTRGNSLSINDQHEAHMKGSWDEWNKTYIGSFAFGSFENMAMWGLYGLPWRDAVRIAISKKNMICWVNSIKDILLFENGQTINYQGGFDAFLNDVIYIDGKKGLGNFQLTHYGRSISVSDTYPLDGIDIDPKMTGFIKNSAWQYENEVRIHIRLSHDTGYEKISVYVPNDVINSMIITTGPYFRWKDDHLYCKLNEEGRIAESGFKNLVNYKELCSMCQHKSFVRKT